MLRRSLALFLFALGCSGPELARNEQPSAADREHAERMAAIHAMREEARLLKERQHLLLEAPMKPVLEKPILEQPVINTTVIRKPAKKATPTPEPKEASSKGGIVIKVGVDDPLDGL